MSLTLASVKTGVFGDLAYWLGTATFDSSYPKGGESLAASSLGMSDVLFLQPTLRGGGRSARAQWDDANSKLQLFAEIAGLSAAVDGETDATGLIQDDDTAAATGVAVYAVVDNDPGIPGAARGHFEFVSPTDALGRGEWDATYKGQYVIQDQDAAATNGTAVRATAAGAGLESTFAAALGAGGPLYVPLSAGGTGHANINHEQVFAKITEATTAMAPQVYFDEDAAEESERLMAVMADNADETFVVYTIKSHGEVPELTNCAAAIVDIFAIGKR